MSLQSLARSSGRTACRFCRLAIPQSRATPSLLGIVRFPTPTPFFSAQRSRTRRAYATSTTVSSLIHDPAEEESQKLVAEGTTHLENADTKAARAAYERSIEVKENSTAWFNLGVCKYHEKDLPGAIEAWEHSLKLAPESADAHTNLASAFAMSSPSRPDLAVKHLKTAASLSPEDPEIQYNLAAVLEAVEQLEEALIAYRRALEGGIEVSKAWTMRNVGSCLLMTDVLLQKRASQNIRNVQAKVLAAKVSAETQASTGKA